MKKRILCIPIIICMLPLLSGCGSVYSNYREVEQLLVVQTMGLDALPGGVKLTFAAPSTARKDNSPVHLSGTGQSITEAIEHTRNYSSEEYLFCAHINHLVLGEATARQGVENYLDYLCRSPEMRIDTPLYVVRDCEANELIAGVIEGGIGICEVLQAVKTNADERGDSYVFTAAQVLRGLNRYGSALLCALDYSPSDEVSADSASQSGSSGGSGSSQDGGSGEEGPSGSGRMTAAVSGYGVLKDGKLCAYIGREEAIGVSFLMNLAAVSHITVHDMYGNPVTLEITGGGSSLTPVWEDGSLKGINVSAKVTASILEAQEAPRVSSASYEDYITARLEEAVSERISAVLGLSRRLRADFLGLSGQVEMADPILYRGMEQDFTQLLPQLELRVSVSGSLSHTNNLR